MPDPKNRIVERTGSILDETRDLRPGISGSGRRANRDRPGAKPDSSRNALKAGPIVPNRRIGRGAITIGNWKMHTISAEARRLAKAVVASMSRQARVSVAICPPFPYLALVGEILKGSRVALGAQNLYPEKEGAFTGEVSPTMLLDLDCK